MAHDRGRRARRLAQPGRHDRRADLGQHRRRAWPSPPRSRDTAASASCPTRCASEKIALLRAYGAEVVVCPTAVARESPQSYYSVAERLAREIPGAFQPNQYFNPANPRTHYETTGPEIWRQTDGRITHFVAGMGTGGTITGVGALPQAPESRPCRWSAPTRTARSTRPGSRPDLQGRGHRRGLLAQHHGPSLVDRVVIVDDREISSWRGG